MQNFIRNIAASYLLVLVLLKVLAVPLFCLHFEMNRDFIAANYCENKARPVMQCNGKCHLSKQLAKAAETPASGEKNNMKLSMVDFLEQIQPFLFEEKKDQPIVHHLFRDKRFAILHVKSIFHPPAETVLS
jgi:hypothetical protein